LHAHDWHTALAPVYLRTLLADHPAYQSVAAVLSVHNAGFQGHFPRESLAAVGLPESLYDWRWLEWYDRVNWLKGGMAFADFVTTVSPTHAHELRTEAGGFGLHDAFIGLKDRFVGILNGIDPAVWDPDTDRHIARTYSGDELSGKPACKAALQRTYGLPEHPRTALLGMSARLVSQKGLDLILGGQALSTANAQFVFLGSGEPRYQAALSEVAAAMPDRIVADFDFTDLREHQLLAGADVLLMPSLYEPCGLTQMRAQRYGALPLGRRVGGLADTIEDEETGFLFDEYAPAALDTTIRRALGLYEEREAWERHMRQAMARDFSWSCSVPRYLEVYHRALARMGRQ
jgi:starch synthase